MKNLSKKSNARPARTLGGNNQSFAGFSKFQLKNHQLKNIKGGSDGSGGDDDNGIITDDVVEG